MYNNTIVVINFIKYLQERNYVKDLTCTLFELMVEKSLMFTYKVNFERTANEDLLSLDMANNGRNRTRMEIALEMLEDPRRLHSAGVHQRPVPEQMKYKIPLLFQFLRNFVYNFHSEMRLPEEKPSSKSEKSYGVSGEEVGEEGDEEDDHKDPEDGNCSEPENGDDSVMAVSGKHSQSRCSTRNTSNLTWLVTKRCTITAKRRHQTRCDGAPVGSSPIMTPSSAVPGSAPTSWIFTTLKLASTSLGTRDCVPTVCVRTTTPSLAG